MSTIDTENNLKNAQNLNEAQSADHSEEIPALYVCLDECYIYSTPGDEQGVPRDDADILYDTVPDEILHLDVEKRNGKYVWCELPKKGWVFLPESDAQYDWGPLDEIYERKKRIREREKALNDAANNKNNKKEEKKENYDEDGYMNTIDEDVEVKQDEDIEEEKEFDATLIVEERRDYLHQRIMMQTIAPELDNEVNKLMQIKFLKWLTFYFRRNPFLPGLIILIIQAVIECIILFDVYSDVILAKEIFNSGQSILFMISSAFIAAPYVIAWTAAAAMNAKKLKQHKNNICQIIGCMLFNIAPIGIAFLLIVDVYHWFECVFIKPFFYLFTCGKQIRTISYGELGYYKLRRVSEIFAEAMPQAVIQLLILLSSGSGGCAKCTPISVVTALISSCFVLLLWCTILYVEGKKNGMRFIEYVTVVFQGSFNFVEMLPAIERGTSTGEKVNWTMYKFSDEGVGHVAKALNSPNCKLSLLKISRYTIKDLNRFGCRFLGGALNQSEQGIDLIVSRLEEDIIALFKKYDIDDGKSLDFEEFVHLCLDIKQNMKEPCLRSDVFLIYSELADSVEHEVWQLDLQIKIKGSLEYIGLLDYKLPLQHAYETGDLTMISLLMAYGYEHVSDENLAEFEYCVSDAITSGKIREALCLCEHKGVPMVVRMENGRHLMACDDDGFSDPYVRVSIFDQQQLTKYRKQTLNPNWEEDLLFIIPFEFMERLLRIQKFNERDDTNKEADDTDNFFYGKDDRGNTTHGISFAAIDINQSVVTGLSMPQYTQNAIKADLKATYNKEFEFQTASSAHDLQEFGDAPGLLKRGTTDPTKASIGSPLTELAAHSQKINKNVYGNSSGKLSIRFRVFDHDVDDDDDFMGSYKARIECIKDDTSKYQDIIHTEQLHNNQLSDSSFNAGTISYRIYLNAVQIYQDYDLHYIDNKEVKDELIRDVFHAEITDNKPVQMDMANIMQI